MQQSIGRRRVLIGMAIILTLLATAFGGWRAAGAQHLWIFADAPYVEQAGIEEAIQRLYQAPSANIHADIALFDSAENAATGLEALSAYYLDALTADQASPWEPVNVTTAVPGASAYTAILDLGTDAPPYGEWALVQAQDDVYVYFVFVVHYYETESEEFALETAVAMLDAMATAPAGLATPAASPDDPPRSGMWAKFPTEEDEVSQRYGVTYTEDMLNYAPEPLPQVIVSTYGNVEGLESVVSRDYGMPETDAGDAPEVPLAYIEIAGFDVAANAEPGFATAATAQLVELGLDGMGLEETEVNVPADEARAYAVEIEGEDESEGESFSVALVISRSGPYVVTVVFITDADDDALAIAEELSLAVLEADAGDSEGTFSIDGTSSGGVWDKLPVAGDEALRGLEPVGDSQYYPDPDDAF